MYQDESVYNDIKRRAEERLQELLTTRIYLDSNYNIVKGNCAVTRARNCDTRTFGETKELFDCRHEIDVTAATSNNTTTPLRGEVEEDEVESIEYRKQLRPAWSSRNNNNIKVYNANSRIPTSLSQRPHSAITRQHHVGATERGLRSRCEYSTREIPATSQRPFSAGNKRLVNTNAVIPLKSIVTTECFLSRKVTQVAGFSNKNEIEPAYTLCKHVPLIPLVKGAHRAKKGFICDRYGSHNSRNNSG